MNSAEIVHVSTVYQFSTAGKNLFRHTNRTSFNDKRTRAVLPRGPFYPDKFVLSDGNRGEN